MRKIQRSVRGKTIALFRECEGDGMRRRGNQGTEQLDAVARRKQRPAYGADHAIARRRAPAFHGIKAILPRKRVRDIGSLQGSADDAPIATTLLYGILR